MIQADLYKDIITNSPNGIIIIDNNKKIKFLNKSIKKYWKIDFCESVGKNIFDMFPEFKDMEETDDDIFRINVENCYYYVLSFKINDKTEEEQFTVYLILDIYENKLLKSELSYQKELAKELEEILEGSFDGILVTDKDGKVLYVNSSYERVAEIKRKDIEGKYMRELINPVWMPSSVAHIVAEQKRPVSKRQVVKSGRHIIVTGRPIFDKQGEVRRIVINARDITEIYELTEELQRAKDPESKAIQVPEEITTEEKPDKKTILAASREMKDVFALAKKVANYQATVLILGESGVGKEEVAKYIHNKSIRKDKPFIVLNCGAIPANLLESELFGYEKGAFTGAMQTGKEGLLEKADQGTVFLDEIGETPLDFQVKLLRFLESKELRRVGSLESKTVDVRIIAATNRDLIEMVEEGSFREDLYYRLNVVQIDVPPLRKRIDDIAPLASTFLHRYNELYNQEKKFTYDVIKELEKYPWTGNVRQLKNVIENMVIISNNDYLQTEDLPWIIKERKNPSQKMLNTVIENSENMTLAEATEALERLIFQKAKDTCNTTREIAAKLDINQSTVVRKLQKYKL